MADARHQIQRWQPANQHLHAAILNVLLCVDQIVFYGDHTAEPELVLVTFNVSVRACVCVCMYVYVCVCVSTKHCACCKHYHIDLLSVQD